MTRITVGVFPVQEYLRHRRLLEALTELYPVEFRQCAVLDQVSGPAALLFGVARADAVRMAQSGVRTLAFVESSRGQEEDTNVQMELSAAPYLPPFLRGRRLSGRTMYPAARLRQEPGDVVLAREADRVVWSHRVEGSSILDLAASEPPPLSEGAFLVQQCMRGSWDRLLPLIHFLREISGTLDWRLPPLRACFMLDDPNLHWPSYGYVDYRTLARDAEVHNYHVSFATVPFDGWYVNPRAAAIFRENKARLSLLVHGNNHIRKELARVRSEAQGRALAAQALARVERLEALAGVEVSRVMAAPHGACSYATAASLLEVGFEAACISRGSLRAHNRNQTWPLSFGLHLAEFLGGGLPVIPRFGLGSDWKSEALLAALFGLPMIAQGHHGDLAGGLDGLRELAAAINALGDVTWTDLKSIARTNFSTTRVRNVLHLKMYARRLSLRVPDGVTRAFVQRPWLAPARKETLKHQQRDTTAVSVADASDLEPIEVTPGTELQIESVCSAAVQPGSVVQPRTAWVAMARRYLCETRDRLVPFARFMTSRNGGPSRQPPARAGAAGSSVR